MRKLFLAPVFILAVLFANAQARIGIAGGPQFTTVLEENNLPRWDSLKNNYDKRTAAHFGFVADLPFGPRGTFAFQPGVYFSAKGRNYLGNYDSLVKVRSNPDSFASRLYIEKGKQFINYIEAPLNLIIKLKLGKKTKFTIGGGPYLGFFLNGLEQTESRIVDVSSSFSQNENKNLLTGNGAGKYAVMDIGINGQAGFEIGRVFINAGYSRGLKDFYQPANYTGTLRHEVMSATLGIYIGKAVAIEKKIKDKDNDGVPDNKDECPSVPGSASLNGCPDKDADGIADKNDKCPDQPGTLADKGCPSITPPAPKDADKDGVYDSDDKCPEIPGVKKYDGCPVPDTDRDGINDDEDKCPDIAGYGRFDGCPVPDKDSDGINDDEDKCPDVPGTKDNKGCPEIKKEILQKVNYAAQRIQFTLGKADLLPASYKVLDSVIKILNENPELKLSIEGHTSSDGSATTNRKLSQDRADNVKAYIVGKGIHESRLTATGLGSSRPVNDEKTEAARAQNRRVELKLSNH
jgi:outer membrane protein OmpA-like peptidoglycan-associated protein